jgi:divalent metal cation (Fe/Co/Zn/Cd) transporter
MPEASIGDLFSRLAEDGKTFARAEVGLYRAIAKRRVGKAAGGAIAIVAAYLLLNAALITLIVCAALALATLIGPLLAGLATFAVVGLIAFLLVRWGAGKLSALSGDEEERAALAAGERLA